MNASTNSPDFFQKLFQSTPLAPVWSRGSSLEHVLVIIGLALVVHFIIKCIREGSEWLIRRSHEKRTRFSGVTETPKFVTITRLIVSALIFVIYFLTIGLVFIAMFHFSDNFLKTYLSSAAVVGLALSFGLQGLVQDVVTGITLIMSDAIDVGDIVDLSGTVGRVELIGLRFTKVINFFNQEIFVPNRNIGNVARFPREGYYAYADVQLSRDLDSSKATKIIADVAKGVWGQFGAIILSEPVVGKVQESTPGGWNFVRVRFKIWPGQTLIETVFRPQVVNAMKALDANYADWMVPVTYRATAAAPDQPVSHKG
ncbi:MAG TPA: mechanosensitive ion channel domain-containing protein [Verrucomicrobiae bacterium]|jgi:small conductance mechanosensitive channel|nr:mechanosensitive ion channel domain-containing protein [Verrucomicrobiae bacterium]